MTFWPPSSEFRRAAAGTTMVFWMVSAMIVTPHGCAGLQLLAWIRRPAPKLRLWWCWIDRGTDYRHVAGKIAVRPGDASGPPHANRDRVFHTGHSRGRGHLRNIDDGNQRRAAAPRSRRDKPAVRNHAVDGADDLRVGDLHRGASMCALAAFLCACAARMASRWLDLSQRLSGGAARYPDWLCACAMPPAVIHSLCASAPSFCSATRFVQFLAASSIGRAASASALALVFVYGSAGHCLICGLRLFVLLFAFLRAAAARSAFSSSAITCPART